MKLSNKFTLARIIIAPVFLILYYFPIWTGLFPRLSMCVAIPLLLFGEFTDFLDGYYARKKNEVSDFGKIFDPFADVFLHLSSFVCYMSSYGEIIKGSDGNPVCEGYLMPLLFILIMWREFGQNFLRMVAAKKGVAIAARKGGKLKTVVYILTSFYVLFLETLVRFNNVPSCFNVLQYIAVGMFILSIVLSYASFIDYLVHFGKNFKDI